LVLPLPSITVHVTVVLPNGKTEGASLVTATTAQLSVVTGAVKKGDIIEHVPGATLKLCGPEQLIVGLILSITVMTCVHVFVLPLPSVTVQVTVVLPNGKVVGALLVIEATLQLSDVVGNVSVGLVVVQAPASVFKL